MRSTSKVAAAWSRWASTPRGSSIHSGCGTARARTPPWSERCSRTSSNAGSTSNRACSWSSTAPRRCARAFAMCSACTRRSSAASVTRNVMKQRRPGPRSRSRTLSSSRGAGMQQFVGLDWATRRARWCAVTPAGAVIDEGWITADENGLAMLVARLGGDGVVACLEMMSGAAWVRERLAAAGWAVQIADARKAKAVGSLAAKTDKLDARVLAELARRDLVPQVYVPTFADRELKERLGRRMHLVRLRTSAINRAHGILSQFGIKLAFDRLRQPDRDELLVGRGVPEVWRRSVGEAVAIVRVLDQRLIPIEQELRPIARADPRVALL